MFKKASRPLSEEGQPYIQAEGLSMWSPFGEPFSNVSISVPKGTLLAVCGKHGAGKTPFLLTLAGRMVPSKGSLTVGGYSLPKQRNKFIRKAGLGIFSGLNDVEENLSAMTILRAEMDVYDRPNKKDFVQQYMEEYKIGHVGRSHIRSYSRLDLVRLGIALGMAGEPELLVVDDIEDQMTLQESLDVVDQLRAIAHEKNIVVAFACTEPLLSEEADMVCNLSESAKEAC